MSNDPNAPLENQPGTLWIQRAVGVSALLVGLALGWLFAYSAFSVATRGDAADTFVWVFLTVVGLLTAFFASVGWRLVLNRSNRHGSLLTPALWFAIALLFAICGLGIAGMVIAQGRFGDLLAPGCALAFALLAARAGRRAMKKTG